MLIETVNSSFISTWSGESREMSNAEIFGKTKRLITISFVMSEIVFIIEEIK